jgi:hypothetical protein
MTSEETDKIEKLPPEPEKTGVEPTQDHGEIEIKSLKGSAQGGISQSPLTDAIREISQGAGPMILLEKFCQRVESDLLEVKEERNGASTEAEKWKDLYYAEKEKCAVLKESVKGSGGLKILKSIFLTLGGVVVGVAGPNLTLKENGLAIAGTILGLLLLFAGWFLPFRSKEEVPS